MFEKYLWKSDILSKDAGHRHWSNIGRKWVNSKSFKNFYKKGVFLEVFLVLSLQKRWSLPLRISSVNVTKFAVFCRFGQIYWRYYCRKTSFFVQSCIPSWSVNTFHVTGLFWYPLKTSENLRVSMKAFYKYSGFPIPLKPFMSFLINAGYFH